MAAPQVVVGGTIASLVVADRLAAAGRPVELHVPERGVGGGFVPIAAGDRRLDLGVRLIELSYDDEVTAAPPLRDYRPGPHGHRPYLQLIDEFVDGLVGGELVTVPTPQTSIDGAWVDDYVLTGNLAGVMGALPDDERAAMADEAARRLEVEGPHGVFAPGREDERWGRTLDDVGRAHAGDLFHDRLMESLAAKILPGGCSAIVAALHRKIWLPLFHPVTVWEACAGRLGYEPDRTFFTVAGGGMGEVARRLIDRVTSSPLVRVEPSGALVGLTPRAGTEVELRFAAGSSLVTDRPVLGVGADELFGAAGVAFEAQRVVATMVWVDVPDEDTVAVPSALFSLEPDIGVFRVTENLADRRPGYRTLCCELDHRADDESAWHDVARSALVELGMVVPSARVESVTAASRPAYPRPGPSDLAAFRESRAHYGERAIPAVVVGGATAFGADSFNEQVVQALAAVEVLTA
jgi:hypothetical protein